MAWLSLLVMAEEASKKEEYEFTPEGEVFGYISLAQARLLAMETARDTPGDYGRRFSRVPMALEITESGEDEDYYNITLTLRPQGDYTGTPGREQFFVGKEGIIAHRQVLSLPTPLGGRRLPLIAAIVGVLVVAAAVAVGVVVGSRSGEAAPAVSAGSIVRTSPAAVPARPGGVSPTNATGSPASDSQNSDHAEEVASPVPNLSRAPAERAVSATQQPRSAEARAAYAAAKAFDREGEYEKAIEKLNEVIRLEPQYAPANSSRGFARLHIGQNEQALRDYDEAIRLDPGALDLYNSYYNRGSVHSDLGQHQRGIQDFNEAIRLNPGQAWLYDGRATIYDKMGDAKKAKADRAKACQLDRTTCELAAGKEGTPVP